MIRTLTAVTGLAALSACTAPGGVGIEGFMLPAPEAPAEQALAAECSGDAAQSAQMTASLNATRSAEGKTELASDARLDQIALSHACDMARSGRLDVAGSNGSNVVDRARAAGYPTCGVVQLVGRGSAAPAVLGNWMALPPQREQVLGQLSYQIGSGAVRGADGQVWHSVVLGNNCR
ncbi:MAG: CAP domain-containing protein [Paracoccus sp. (in: a-proteobacteria)]